MPLNAAQWQKHLDAGKFGSVYLLVGEELLVLEAADALRRAARVQGYDEREVLSVEAHFNWDDLARSAAGMSLFASRRLPLPSILQFYFRSVCRHSCNRWR